MIITSEALKNAKRVFIGVNKNKYYPITDEFNGSSACIKSDLFEITFSNNERGLTYAELFCNLKEILANIYGIRKFEKGFKVENSLSENPIVLLPVLTKRVKRDQVWSLALIKNNELTFPFEFNLVINYEMSAQEIFERLCSNYLSSEAEWKSSYDLWISINI